MPCWTSPWPVAAPLDAHLRAAGLKRCQERLDALPADALILYAPPDALLTPGLASAHDPPTPQQLATTYRQLQTLYGRHRLIADWRLQALTPEAIRGWLDEALPPRASQPFPDPEPLSALLAKTLMERQPHLLEAYLDLELIAELAGGAPDTAYSRRLSQAIADSRTLLEHCWLPHHHIQALRQDLADQIAREDALAFESQQAREAEALLRVEVDQARDARERLVQATEIREARLGQLEETLASQVSRLLRLEAELHQIRAEREESRAAVEELQPQLAARDEELRRAREAEAGLHARIEALEGESRRAHEEAEERLLRQLHVLEEHERLVLDLQGHRVQISHLEEQRAAQAESLRRSREERDRESARVAALEAERKDLLQARAAVEGQKEAVEREKAAVLAREAELQVLVASHEHEARQARDAEVRLHDRVGLLERENQRLREESEAMRGQFEHLRLEQNRRDHADQGHALRLRHLEETLRQAQAREHDLHAQVEALERHTGEASEETRRLTDQLHHLHEELEQIFLQGQASDALIAAQHQQLQRAQSLMSRLLVQATQTLVPSPAVSVEVLSSHPAKVIPGSTLDDQGRRGRSTRLLRRFWTP